MNLPELYARVIAKRPELAVKDLTPPIPGVRSYWLLPNFLADDTDGNSIAAALILARWVEALPHYTWLGHDGDPINGWKVRGVQDGDNYELIIVMIDAKPTPLEAIAAFYLGENT